jgi:hypothetical protein
MSIADFVSWLQVVYLNLSRLGRVDFAVPPMEFLASLLFLLITYLSAVFDGFDLYLETCYGSIILGNIIPIFFKKALFILATSFLSFI